YFTEKLFADVIEMVVPTVETVGINEHHLEETLGNILGREKVVEVPERTRGKLALYALLVDEGVIHNSLFEIREADEVVILRRNGAEFLIRMHVLNVRLDQG